MPQKRDSPHIMLIGEDDEEDADILSLLSDNEEEEDDETMTSVLRHRDFQSEYVGIQR